MKNTQGIPQTIHRAMALDGLQVHKSTDDKTTQDVGLYFTTDKKTGVVVSSYTTMTELFQASRQEILKNLFRLQAAHGNKNEVEA